MSEQPLFNKPWQATKESLLEGMEDDVPEFYTLAGLMTKPLVFHPQNPNHKEQGE